ncbi:hypothetical protein BJ508DRAFT_14394 [Ascobolus immersus RN42]|uniref:DUF7779 domain-containing protein n=1 Tax=Ascobolus immersus RN42 TaxID=1160509 RepID=A0A3N4IM55_ASCIM|nr:hypothetical protein BJ508DRAFT_14394 [Ascobolus immersus RN42]
MTPTTDKGRKRKFLKESLKKLTSVVRGEERVRTGVADSSVSRTQGLVAAQRKGSSETAATASPTRKLPATNLRRVSTSAVAHPLSTSTQSTANHVSETPTLQVPSNEPIIAAINSGPPPASTEGLPISASQPLTSPVERPAQSRDSLPHLCQETGPIVTTLSTAPTLVLTDSGYQPGIHQTANSIKLRNATVASGRLGPDGTTPIGSSVDENTSKSITASDPASEESDPGLSLVLASATGNSGSVSSSFRKPVEQLAADAWKSISELAASHLSQEERKYLGNPKYESAGSLYDALTEIKATVKNDVGSSYDQLDIQKVNSMQEQLDRFSPVVDSVAKYSPNGVGIIWGLSKQMAQTSLNKKKAFDLFLKAMDTILDKLTLCELYARTYLTGEVPQEGSAAGNGSSSQSEADRSQRDLFLYRLERSLPQLYAAVVVYAVKANTYLQKGKTTLSFEEAQQPYFRRIEEAESMIEKLATVAQMQRIQGISRQVTTLDITVQDMKSNGIRMITRVDSLPIEDRVKPLRLLHYSENPSYTGREAIGSQLAGIAAASGCHRRVAICGLGGVGKTQIAIRFAYQGIDPEKTHIFWVHGGNPVSFKRAYLKIAELLDTSIKKTDSAENRDTTNGTFAINRFDTSGDLSQLQQLNKKKITEIESDGAENAVISAEHFEDDETVLNRVRDWFEGGTSQTISGPLDWVLIVDNADNPLDYEPGSKPSEIAKYLPQSGSGMLIITTRAASVAHQLGCKVIRVEKMDLDEATSLFNKFYYASLDSESRVPQLGPESKESLSQLLNDLELLPLAIVAAATFLRKTHATIDEYLELMKSTEKTPLLSKVNDIHRDTQQIDGMVDSDVSQSVLTAFHITFKRIETLAHGKVASDMLGVLSFIDRRAIPEILLKQAVELQAGLLEFRVALGHLLDFSLITLNADGKTYDMHRLVHHSVKVYSRRSEERWKECQYFAYSTIVKLFPGLIKRTLHARYNTEGSLYRLHAKEIIGTILPKLDDWRGREDKVQLSELLQEVASVEPPIEESDMYLDKALAILGENKNCLDVARVELRRGVVSLERKEMTMAMGLTVSALRTMEAELGPNHYETIFCYIRLSRVYEMQKDYSSMIANSLGFGLVILQQSTILSNL